MLAQCRTNLPSRTHDITTPAWRPVIYHPAANLHYVWRTVETVENTVHLALGWLRTVRLESAPACIDFAVPAQRRGTSSLFANLFHPIGIFLSIFEEFLDARY